MALILLSSLMLALANKEIASPEWDLEWLVTLPAPTRTLLRRAHPRAHLINPFGIIALWPFLSVLAYRNGQGYAAPLLGALLALPLLARGGRRPDRRRHRVSPAPVRLAAAQPAGAVHHRGHGGDVPVHRPHHEPAVCSSSGRRGCPSGRCSRRPGWRCRR